MKKLIITALMLTCINLNAMDVEDKNRNEKEPLSIYRLIAFNSNDFEYLHNPDNSKPPLDSWLIQATIKGQLEKVKELHDQGADVNTMSIFGWTPLHEAALRNYTEIISFLLAKGANPNGKYQKCLKKIPDYNFHLMIHYHDSIDAVPLLGEIYENNDTPLHLAAQFGNLEAIHLLIEAGANPQAKNNDNKTPSQLASDQQTKNYFRAFFHEIRLKQAIKNLGPFYRR